MTRPLPRWMNALTFIHAKLTGMMAAMAVQLFLPTDTYGAGTNSGVPAGNWRIISHYLDEKSLAAVLWAVACVGVVGLCVQSRWVKNGSITVLGLAHGILASFFIWSNPAGIGALLLCGYAIDGGFVVFRRAREAS